MTDETVQTRELERECDELWEKCNDWNTPKDQLPALRRAYSVCVKALFLQRTAGRPRND